MIMTQEEWQRELDDEDLDFRLSSLAPKSTRLPVIVWIASKSSEGNVTPRLLFSNSNNLASCTRGRGSLVPISLDACNPKLLLDDIQLNITPSEIEAIKSWIIRNYQTLMAHWCGEIDTCEAVMNLKPYDE